jgi:hypothetical protein
MRAVRPIDPPKMEFFAAQRASPGSEFLTLRLGPLEIELGGLDEGLASLLANRYGPYAAREASGAADALRVRLAREDADWFMTPLDRPELVQVRLACDGDRLRFLSYRVAGWFDAHGGRGELLLARGGPYEPVERALENYIRAAVAWQASSRGGALVHAASAVWNERGYLFYGESGAGKSTLSACNRRGRVVSDDLSLLLPGADGGLDLVGSPFRGTYTGGPPVLGRFPLAAGFRLIQAPAAAVQPVARARGFAELVGNLPFVAELFPTRPDLFERVQRAFAGVPLAHLLFRKDDSYWDAIAAAQ